MWVWVSVALGLCHWLPPSTFSPWLDAAIKHKITSPWRHRHHQLRQSPQRNRVHRDFPRVCKSLQIWEQKAKAWLRNVTPHPPDPRAASTGAQTAHSDSSPKSQRQAKQWHQFIAAQKEFLQYSFVSLIASTTVLPSQIIDAPRCSEPHVNRQRKVSGRHVALTLSHILLCFWLALNRRTACIPVFPSKWWLSAASSIGQPLCELHGAKKVSAIASHRRE